MPDISNRGEITGGRGRMWLTDDIQKHDPNASMLVARNGRWFGCVVGRGVYTDVGVISAPDTMLVGDVNSAHGAVGQDGTIGFWLHYPDGGDVQLIAMDGSVVDIPGAFPQGNGQFCIYDATRAVWVDGRARLRAFGLPLPLSLPGTLHNLNVFEHEGRFWILYHANVIERIVCHPFNELRGYHFDKGWYPRVRQGTARGIVLAIAANPADVPGRDLVLDFSKPRIDLMTLLRPESKPKPIPEPSPMPDTMMLPADVHATYVAVVAKFPHTGDDDDRREAHKKAVQTVRARHGERWVWKTEHSHLGEGAKDAMGEVPEPLPIEHGRRSLMYIWDMIIGDTRQPKPPHESEPLREAYILINEVPPFDWLADGVPQPGPTLPPPTGPKPHVYVAGDHDSGFCDFPGCGQRREALIHASVTEPDPAPIPPSGDTLYLILVELRKLNQHLGVR